MSLKGRFISIFTVTAALVVFSCVSFAQDTTTSPTTPDKAEKPFKGDHHWERGERKFGHEGGMGKHGEHHGGMMRMLHGINLTEEQKTQIHSILEANKPDQAAMEEVRTLSRAKHDGTITADQQARLDTLKTQRREKGRSIHEQIQGILTAEQKTQIEQNEKEMKNRREEFRQKRELRRTEKPAATITEKPAN